LCGIASFALKGVGKTFEFYCEVHVFVPKMAPCQLRPGERSRQDDKGRIASQRRSEFKKGSKWA
jgi:hypothetical protein